LLFIFAVSAESVFWRHCDSTLCRHGHSWRLPFCLGVFDSVRRISFLLFFERALRGGPYTYNRTPTPSSFSALLSNRCLERFRPGVPSFPNPILPPNSPIPPHSIPPTFPPFQTPLITPVFLPSPRDTSHCPSRAPASPFGLPSDRLFSEACFRHHSLR